MTTRQKLESMLYDYGVFEEQATAIVDKFIADCKVASSVTWNRPANEYPDVMYAALMTAIKPYALAWIVENAPEAWFRPMFESKP